MTSPKISIIVPVYKVEQYLRRCLDSIVAQTCTDWECILIDDGSPDNSGKICDEYAEKDGRFKVIHQENQGVSAARNAGLDCARGEWVTFVDSDDWVERKMLYELLNFALKNNAEVVVSGFYKSDGRTHIAGYRVKQGWMKMPDDFVFYIQGPWAKLFSSSYLSMRKFRFPNNITVTEDLVFNFYSFYNSKLVYGTNYIGYYYYVNVKSTMHTMSYSAVQDEFKAISLMEQYLSLNGTNDKWERFLTSRKIHVKNDFALSINPPRFDMWRHTYPELDWTTLKQGSDIFAKLFYFCLIIRMDYFARFMLKIRARLH